MQYARSPRCLYIVVLVIVGLLGTLSARSFAATTDAQKALDDNPKDATARVDLIQSDINGGNYTAAERLADDGVKLLPSAAALWSARGAAYFNDGVAKRSSGSPSVDELKIAAESYDQAVKLDAHTVPVAEASAAFAQYGLVLSQQQQFAQCLVYADKATTINSQAWQYAMLKGDCESGLGHYQAALADYQTAQRADDKSNAMVSARLLAAMGNAQLKTGDVPGGLQSLNKAAATDPKSPFAYQTLYAYYTSTSAPDMPKALDALQHLADLEPGDASVQITIGNLYLRESKLDLANAAFSKAMQIDPKNADAQFGFAELAAAQYDMKSADAALGKAIQMNPGDASFYQASMAQLLLSIPASSQLRSSHPTTTPGATASYTATSEQAVQAQKYADAATRADPSDGTAWYWLGVSYAQEGRKDMAGASLRKAQQIFGSKSCVDIHFANRAAGTSCLDYQKMMLAQANAAYTQLNDTNATLMGTNGIGGGTGKSIDTNGDMPH